MNDSEIQSWIEKANHDIGTAELTFHHKPEYYDTICFHCQQDQFSLDYYEKASKLESYAVDIRYPDSNDEIPTIEELKEAIGIVNDFQKAIIEKLSKIL